MKVIAAALFIATMATDPVGYSEQSSQMGQSSWIAVPSQNSASLGKNGALIVNSTVLTIDRYSNFLITFWEDQDKTYRCIEKVAPGPVFSDITCSLPK